LTGWHRHHYFTPRSQLFQSEIIQADPPHRAIKLDIMTNWWMRPLRTFHTLTDRATNANGIKGSSLYLCQLVCIDQITRMVHLAAKRHGKFWCRLIRA
jgi:hypothetical protein